MSTRSAVVLALVVTVAVVPLGAATTVGAESGGCSFPVSETDATGTTVSLSAAPDRIVTLNPSAAQTVYEISASDDPAWDRVVGVSQFASYLPGASSKASVGNGRTDATVERTIGLVPDLVLAPNTIPDATVQQLRDAGLTVYKFRAAEDLDRIVEKTRLTGRLVGECDGATDTADTMESDLDTVREALEDEERPTAIYYFFSFTAGSDTFIDEIMTTAGVENIAATGGASEDQSSGYFVANAETIVSEDPTWFLLNSDEYAAARVPAGPNGAFTETTAYREGNALVLDANEISQPAPRAVDAVIDIVRVVHPEAYREEIRGELDRSGAPGGEREVRSTALADGTVRLEARNIGRDDRVSFALPARANATVDVQRVNVSLATVNPTFSLDVRPLRADEGPAPQNGTHELSRFSMTANGLPDADVDRISVRFAVNESVLSERSGSPENVTLYRHNGTWGALDTRHVGTQNGSAVFEASTSGLSTFAVAVPESRAAQVATATPTTKRTTASTTDATAQSTAMSTPASTTMTPSATTASELPGFGVVVALAALLAALVAARVRRR